VSGRLSRYLLVTLLRNTLLAVAAMAGVAVAVDGLERAGLLIAHAVPARDVAAYLGLRMATVIHLLLPPAAALGTALTVAGLRHRGEWDAMRALGAGAAQLAPPFVLLAAGLAAGLLVYEGWALPRAIEGASRVESTRVLGGMPRLGSGAGMRWWRLDHGVLVATAVDPAGDELHGVTWLQSDGDGRVTRRIDAAALVHTERGWVATDGVAWDFAADGALQRAALEAEVLTVDGLHPGGIRRRLLPLAQHDLPMLWAATGPEARFCRHARLAHPLTAGLVLLLAVALAVRSRPGRARAAGVALTLAAAATVLDLLGGTLAPSLGWPTPLPWALPAALGAGLIAAAYRTTK